MLSYLAKILMSFTCKTLRVDIVIVISATVIFFVEELPIQ